jgi:hypothetical protein
LSLPDQVREACRWVASQAESVHLDGGRLREYAGTLPELADVPGIDPEAHFVEGSREDVAAFVLCIDAMNFGSGWWPTVRKRPGRSGYLTMAGGLADRFRAHGPWSAQELSELQTAELAGVLGQDPGHEVVALFAEALRDLATHIRDDFGGAWLGPVDAAGGSAVALAELLAGWDCFFDISPYEGRRIPFFKRAQLTAADLQAAGVQSFGDLDRLTAFADNLVPHVLTVDGVLRLEDDLAERIRSGTLLEHDSPEEVEMRACAVRACELLSAESGLSEAAVDFVLWHRGQEPRIKAHPRPRARSTAY